MSEGGQRSCRLEKSIGTKRIVQPQEIQLLLECNKEQGVAGEGAWRDFTIMDLLMTAGSAQLNLGSEQLV